jgi:hypothetical protein
LAEILGGNFLLGELFIDANLVLVVRLILACGTFLVCCAGLADSNGTSSDWLKGFGLLLDGDNIALVVGRALDSSSFLT